MTNLITTERFAYRRERRDAKRAFSRCYFSLVVFIAVASVIITGITVAALILFGPERATAILSNPYVTYGLQVVVMYMIAFPIFLLITLGLPRANYGKRSMGFGEFVSVFFISCFAVTVGSFISYLLSLLIPSADQGVIDGFVIDTPLWLVIAVVVIIGPIVEEVVFRKVLIDRLGVYGDRRAIFVSAIAFGFFHGNPEQLFYATALGIIFGYVYAKTRKIIYPIILHMLINLLGSVPAILLSEILAEMETITEEAAISGADAIKYLFSVGLFLLVRYGFALAGMAIFLYCIFAGKIRFSRNCHIRLKAGTALRCSVFNLGAILFFLYFGLQIALYINPGLFDFLLSA